MEQKSVGHTPGPWTRVPQTKGGDLIAREFATGNQMNPKGLRLVAFMMARGDSLPEDEANARLITAAPDLLAALRMTAEALAEYTSTCEALDAGLAAIAKARGEA